jgi:endonuclease YncB( thermonuclease family)
MTKGLCSVVLLLITLLPSAFARTLTGTVIKIADGDTLTILASSKRPLKIRLAEIDAPEKAQAFGNASKQSLATLCFRKTAVVHYKIKDRYNRIIGRVYCDGIDTSAEQVHRGMAWVYDHYATDQRLYQLQYEAQKARIGLWQDQHAIPPWKYRRQPHASQEERLLTVLKFLRKVL